MKNKKIIIISCCIIVAVLTALVILVMNNQKKEVIYSSMDNMINLDSYTIYTYQYEKTFDLKNYEEEILIGKDIDKYESSSTSYHYNNKIIRSGNDNQGNTVWYYKPSNLISNDPEESYRTIYNRLFEQLKKYEYKRSGNKFSIADSIDNSFESHLEDIKTYTGGQLNYDDDSGEWNEEIYIIGEVEILLNGKFIDEIDVIYYNNDGEELERFIIKFSNYNTTNVELTNEILESLNKTTAGDFVGTYSYETKCNNCSDSETIKNQLTLTSEFEWYFCKGWELKYMLYDGEFVNSGTKAYYVEDDDFYIIDNFSDEVLEKGKIYQDRIELLDENGNVKETFIKE